MDFLVFHFDLYSFQDGFGKKKSVVSFFKKVFNVYEYLVAYLTQIHTGIDAHTTHTLTQTETAAAVVDFKFVFTTDIYRRAGKKSGHYILELAP
jgi:hypothetical protein